MLEPMVSHDQKSHVEHHFICLDWRITVVPVVMPLASCDAAASAKGITGPKKSYCTSFWLSYLKTAVVLFLIPLASYDSNSNANGITWPKSHIVLHFDHVELTNVFVALTMRCKCQDQMHHMAKEDILHLISIILTKQMYRCHWSCHIASHDANAGVSSIIWPKCDVASHFNHLDLTNGMVPLMTLLASCNSDTSISGITWSKMSCCTLFESSWPNECIHAIDNTIGITCYWCQSQQYQMTETVLLCLVSIILTLKTKWCHWQCHQCHIMLALVPTASHDQKSHDTPCFNCVYPMNKMVQLMMHLTSHDSNAGTNDMTWLKTVISPPFHHCDLMNTIVPLTAHLNYRHV